MEDFNAHVDLTMDTTSTQKKVPDQNITTIKELNFTDTYRFFNPDTPGHTWSHNNTSSKIDYIWVSPTLTAYITKAKTKNATTITDSDHQILLCTIRIHEIIF